MYKSKAEKLESIKSQATDTAGIKRCLLSLKYAHTGCSLKCLLWWPCLAVPDSLPMSFTELYSYPNSAFFAAQPTNHLALRTDTAAKDQHGSTYCPLPSLTSTASGLSAISSSSLKHSVCPLTTGRENDGHSFKNQHCSSFSKAKLMWASNQ